MSPDASSKLTHATCLCVEGQAVLIRGASGSGKTTLAIAIARRAKAAGLDVAMVADDQVLLHAQDATTLIANCPDGIMGKIEVHYLGICDHGLPVAADAPVNLVVDLAEPIACERMQDGVTIELMNCRLPQLTLPSKQADLAATAIFVALGLPCWY